MRWLTAASLAAMFAACALAFGLWAGAALEGAFRG